MFFFFVLAACPLQKASVNLDSVKTYLDIGCTSDPNTATNTQSLYTRGLYGKCFQSGHHILSFLPRRDLVHMTVSNTSGLTIFSNTPNTGWMGTHAGVSRYRFPLQTLRKRNNMWMRTLTPSSLLQRYYSNVTMINLVAVSKMDNAVGILKVWPFSLKRCVSMFVVQDPEWCNSKSILPQLQTLFKMRGYKYVESAQASDHVFETHCSTAAKQRSLRWHKYSPSVAAKAFSSHM